MRLLIRKMRSSLTAISAFAPHSNIRRSQGPPKFNWEPRRLQNFTLSRNSFDTVAFYTTPPDTPSSHGITSVESEWGRIKAQYVEGMEGDEQRRRQFDSSAYPRGYVPDPRARTSQVANASNVRSGMSGNTPDKMRQSQQLTTRPSTSAAVPTGAAGPQDVSGFAYAQSQQYTNPQIQGAPISYQDYQTDPQRQQQQYPQYPSQMVYGVPQVSPTQGSYDPTGQFQPRQSGAVEVMSGQFGMPSYFNPGTSSISSPQTATSQYSTAQFPPNVAFNATTDLTRSTLASSYPTVDPEFNPAPSVEAAESSEREQRTPDRFDFFYSQYRRSLKETNENSSRGRLVEAGESLLELSGGLLGNVENLGEESGSLHSAMANFN